MVIADHIAKAESLRKAKNELLDKNHKLRDLLRDTATGSLSDSGLLLGARAERRGGEPDAVQLARPGQLAAHRGGDDHAATVRHGRFGCCG